MKNIFKKVVTILAGLLILPVLALAVNVTVPSAPTKGYFLVSTTTGQYLASSTPSFLNGFYFNIATGTAATTTNFYTSFFNAITASTTNFSAVLSTTTSATSTNFSTTNASTTKLWVSGLGTAAGTFVAIDPSGRLIATTTPINTGGASQGVNWATATFLGGTPTYANGSSGVGATLTEVGFGALSVDGNSPVVGDRILVKNQASAFQNGIYSVTVTGSGAASYLLTRTTDYNTSTEITPGLTTYVVSGTANADSTWAVSYTSPLTIGSTNLNYTELAGGGAAVASVSNSDSTLTISPTTGAVVASLNLAQGNIWTAASSTYTKGVTIGTSTTTSATTTSASFTTASTTNQFVSSLGTAAGTFVAADASGKLIATTSPSSSAVLAPIASDGSDGAVTFDGSTNYNTFSSRSGNVYTLTRDVYATTFTVNSGKTASTSGYRIFAQTTITNSGTIANTGGSGTTGATGDAGGSPGGVGGAGGVGGTLPAGMMGGAGQISPTGSASGGIAATSSNYDLNANAGPTGGAGGAGTGGSGGSGGAGGTDSNAIVMPRNSFSAMHLYSISATSTINVFLVTPGAGGGGGAGGSTGAHGGAGGGAGGSGGVVWLSARTITNSGTITAAGGGGGNGGGTSGNGGGGGGGSGGNGGAIFLIYNSLSNSGTITAAGGALGTGGVSQGSGTNGTNGSNGTAGVTFQISN